MRRENERTAMPLRITNASPPAHRRPGCCPVGRRRSILWPRGDFIAMPAAGGGIRAAFKERRNSTYSRGLCLEGARTARSQRASLSAWKRRLQPMGQRMPPVETVHEARQPGQRQILLAEMLLFVGGHHLPVGGRPGVGTVRKEPHRLAAAGHARAGDGGGLQGCDFIRQGRSAGPRTGVRIPSRSRPADAGRDSTLRSGRTGVCRVL